MTYYLSGPMSGIPDFNFPAFTAACASLRAQGLTIVSPHEKDSEGDLWRPWEEYLREDIALLMKECGAMILLPGWTNSTGAKLEVTIALALKWPIYFYLAAPQYLVNLHTGQIGMGGVSR